MAQVSIEDYSSSSQCYVDQSSNESYSFTLDIGGMDATSVIFTTSAPSFTFSNPTGGIVISGQNITFSGNYPIGSHTFEFDVSTGGDIGTVYITATVTAPGPSSASINIPLTFVSSNPVSSVTCNSHINVTLDTDCFRALHPDDILEGSNYQCWDLYEVHVMDAQGNDLGNEVGAAQKGQTLEVHVVGPNNNICWGQITVEDKFPPQFVCEDVHTDCNNPTAPGSLMAPKLKYSIENESINDGSPNLFPILVSGMRGSSIDSVRITTNITHNNSFELSATLTSPNSGPVTISDLTSEVFQNFNGQDPNGTWNLLINDNVFSGASHQGILHKATLHIYQSGGVVAFPLPLNADIDTINAQNYVVHQGLDSCGEAALSFIDNVSLPDCTSPFEKIITRVWNAEDWSGNVSQCIQTIYVQRTGLEDIVYPPDYDGLDLNPLSCLIYQNWIPPVDTTGVPVNVACANIEIFDPVDVKLDVCDAEYKLVRTWKAIDWCTSESYEHEQIIKVETETLPLLDCGLVDTISTHPYDCSGYYFVPDFDSTQPIFQCSAIKDTIITYAYDDGSLTIPADNQFVDWNVNVDPINGLVVSDLPLGRSWIRYTFESDCGDFNHCTRAIDVVDNIPPNPVCDQHTVFSGVIEIDGFGNSFVEAQSFDDGSTDNCGTLTYSARKVTDICSNPANTEFGPTVMFCCEEVGSTITVEFRVCDGADHNPWKPLGNCNSCFVEVEVQDNLFPYINYCPDEIDIDCFSTDYTDDAITGVPQFIDNCHAYIHQVYYDTDSIDACGEGFVIKTWVVTDDQQHTATCSQRINLVNNDRFDYDDIDWPDDYEEVQDCNAEMMNPEDLSALYSEPILTSDACDMVSFTYVDQVFDLVPQGKKILRMWTVIDWCQYPDNGGIWNHEQILKCTNNNAVPLVINGGIVDEYNRMVNNVEVQLDADLPGYPRILMNDGFNGGYLFGQLDNNETYTVSCSKEDDPMNGVSTLDLVQIQKHLLDINPFDSDYKKIASDVNNSGSISSLDLIELRKLILGIRLEFPNDQKSWRFVKADFASISGEEPFPFTEVIDIVGMVSAANNQDFVAVKIGDVTGDASPSNLATPVVGNRSSESLVLRTERKTTSSHDEILVYVENYNEVHGLQFNLEANIGKLIDVNILSDRLADENIHFDSRQFRLSYHSNQPEDLSSEQALLSFKVEKGADLVLLEDVFADEAYAANLNIMDVKLRDNEDQMRFEVQQNVPNPFSTNTKFLVTMPEASTIDLTLYDPSGKVVYSRQIEVIAGEQWIEIDSNQLPKGLIYYQVSYPHGTQTKKMIHL